MITDAIANVKKLNKEAYTKNETSQILGVSIRTIEHYMRDGKLKYKKIGWHVVIPAQAIKNYVNGK